MEKPDHLGCPGRVFDLLRNERRDLLDYIYQGHRWSPIFLFLRDDVQKEVSAVRKRGPGKLSKGNRLQTAYLGARGNQGRLERELVPQKYFKVEAINRFVQALGSLDRCPFHLKLQSQIKSNGRDT